MSIGRTLQTVGAATVKLLEPKHVRTQGTEAQISVTSSVAHGREEEKWLPRGWCCSVSASSLSCLTRSVLSGPRSSMRTNHAEGLAIHALTHPTWRWSSSACLTWIDGQVDISTSIQINIWQTILQLSCTINVEISACISPRYQLSDGCS